MCTILCCDASPIGIYWQCILIFDKIVCRIVKESECKILSDSDVCMIIDLDIVFAGGAWILKMNKEIGTLLPKKELIQVE